MHPQSELCIDEKLIRQLLKDQAPLLSFKKIQFTDAGWDNENYKLGDKLLIRMPQDLKVIIYLKMN